MLEGLARHDHNQLHQLSNINLAQFTQGQREALDVIMTGYARPHEKGDGRWPVLPSHAAWTREYGQGLRLHHVVDCHLHQGKRSLAGASSGVSSILLPRARTAHSLLNIYINIGQHSSCLVEKQGSRAKILRRADVIFWDETTAVHRYCVEAVERCSRDTVGNNPL